VVLVNDPDKNPDTLPDALTRTYHLTAAESRLAELLARGETVVRAAERLGISHNTARTHLQRVYQKTGTSHQGQLIRLLLAGIGNLLPDEPAKIHFADDQASPAPEHTAMARRNA
jgi:DNA-binding CsgD family transcriptional regulator